MGMVEKRWMGKRTMARKRAIFIPASMGEARLDLRPRSMLVDIWREGSTASAWGILLYVSRLDCIRFGGLQEVARGC